MWDSTANEAAEQAPTRMHLGLIRGELGGTGDQHGPGVSIYVCLLGGLCDLATATFYSDGDCGNDSRCV